MDRVSSSTQSTSAAIKPTGLTAIVNEAIQSKNEDKIFAALTAVCNKNFQLVFFDIPASTKHAEEALSRYNGSRNGCSESASGHRHINSDGMADIDQLRSESTSAMEHLQSLHVKQAKYESLKERLQKASNDL